MRVRRTLRRICLLSLSLCLLVGSSSLSQNTARLYPRPEPVAETRLLMQGLNQPNFQGLQKLLQQRPADAEAWTFARGQALLIAESGNLLLLRPPRAQGQETWLDRAADLRVTATRLARAVAGRDYERSRVELAEITNACNRCHQTFRVPVRLTAGTELPIPTERQSD